MVACMLRRGGCQAWYRLIDQRVGLTASELIDVYHNIPRLLQAPLNPRFASLRTLLLQTTAPHLSSVDLAACPSEFSSS